MEVRDNGLVRVIREEKWRQRNVGLLVVVGK